MVTIAAPTVRGNVQREDLVTMKKLGFMLTETCGLVKLTHAKQVAKSPSDVTNDTLQKVATSMFTKLEKQLLPGKEIREKEKLAEEKRKAMKRKEEQYCEYCKCSRCTKKRQRI